MRLWTIPILGVAALSVAVPSGAEARLRFGPRVVLGAAPGPLCGVYLHSLLDRPRGRAVPPSAGLRRVGRWGRRGVPRTPRPEVSAPPPPTNPPAQPSASREQTAAIFWPDAAADLADY